MREPERTHPDTAELLEPTRAATRLHLAGCAVCRQQLQFAQATGEALRALPEAKPPGDAWPQVRRGLPRRRGTRHPGWWGAALAAGVAGVLVLLPQLRSPATLSPPAAQPLPGLVARSQALEADWQRLAPVRVVSLREAARGAALEDRIALLDQMLAHDWDRERDAGLEQELWRQRVESMQQLVALRWSRAALKEPDSLQRR